MTERTDYSGFVSTASVVDAARHIHHQDSRLLNITSEIMDSNRGDAQRLAEYLEKLGFRRLHKDNTRYGCNAIVFEGNDSQVIRIVHKRIEKEPRLDSPFILQPIATYDAPGDYRIEVLPEVHTLSELMDEKNIPLRENYGVTYAIGQKLGELKTQLINDALSQNIMIFDAKTANIAVVKNKNGELVPLIIDADAACEIPDSSYIDNNYGHMGRMFKVFATILKTVNPEAFHKKAEVCVEALGKVDVAGAIPIFTDFINDYKAHHAVFTHSAEYYASAQTDHLESLGLTTGAANKVLNDEQLDRALREFVAERTHSGEQGLDPTQTVGYHALKAGVSKSEFGAAAKASAARSEEGFCHRIRAELENNHGVDFSGRGV
jgi:hypothetical protein